MDVEHYNSLISKLKDAKAAADETHEAYVIAHDKWADASNSLLALEKDMGDFIRLGYTEDSGLTPIPQSFTSVRHNVTKLRQ